LVFGCETEKWFGFWLLNGKAIWCFDGEKKNRFTKKIS